MEDRVKNKKLVLYTILEFSVLMLMLIAFGAWDWVNMEFSLSRMGTGKFWQDAITKSILYTSAMFVATLGYLQRHELNDTRYSDLLSSYRGRLPFKDARKKQFETYLDDFKNVEIKKEYIRTMLNTRLLKIQKHEKDDWVDDYFLAKKCDDPKEFEFSSKKSALYFKKRTRLELMLEDSFIDEHWMQIRCKHPRIFASQFGYYLDIRRNRDSRYKLDNEIVKDTSRKLSAKSVSVIISSMLIAAFILAPDTNELANTANAWVVIMFRYVIRIGMMAASFGMGVYNGKYLFEDNYLLPLINRNTVLDEFKDWVDIHPVEEKGVEAIKDQIEAELRKEYENKLQNAKEEIKTQAIKQIEELKNDRLEGAS